jgi:hypothetical protein
VRKPGHFGVSTVALAGLLASACHADPDSAVPPTPSSAVFSEFSMAGPDQLAPGESARFSVAIRLADGTIKAPDPATSVHWSASGPQLIIGPPDASGGVTVTAGSTAFKPFITAEVKAFGASRSSKKDVLILPPGTFFLTGSVLDAGESVPLWPARVEVTPGPFVFNTGGNGRYFLYGVPPDVTIRVTADRYAPFEQTLHLSGQSTQTVAPISLTNVIPFPDYSGHYTFAIDVADACSGSGQMPADLQHRTYDAELTQSKVNVMLTLTEPRFQKFPTGTGNRLDGFAFVTGVRFFLRFYYPPDPEFNPNTPSYPSLSERLSDGTVLVVGGYPDNGIFGISSALQIGSRATGLSGQMADGEIQHWASGYPDAQVLLGSCRGPIRLSLNQK